MLISIICAVLLFPLATLTWYLEKYNALYFIYLLMIAVTAVWVGFLCGVLKNGN